MVQFTSAHLLNPDKRFGDNLEAAERRLQSLESVQSGPDWPTIPRPHMMAINSTLGWVGQRNGANTAWIPLWRLDSSPDHVYFGGTASTPLTSAHTIDLSDADGSNWLRCDAESVGPFSITFPAGSISPRSRVVVQKIDGGANAVTVDLSASGQQNHLLTVPGDTVGLISAPNGGWFLEYRRVGNVVTRASGGSALRSDRYIRVDCSSASVEVSLPPVVGDYIEHPMHTVKLIADNAGANQLTVKPHPGGSIDGLAPNAAYTFPAITGGIWPVRTFLFTGGNQWLIVAGV